jgi:hypothetical protein
MRILVQQIIIRAMSTIGYGAGVDLADGQRVCFYGDHRPLADIQKALDLKAGVPVMATVENWQVIGRNA